MKKLIGAITFSLLLVGCGDANLSGFQAAAETPEVLQVIPIWGSVRLFSDATGITMTNAAISPGVEISNSLSRMYVYLTDFSEVRAQFSSSLTAQPVQLRIDYSLNNGGAWFTLVPEFTSSATPNDTMLSPYNAIPEEAKTDVLVRAVIVGNGTYDPVIRYISLDFKGTTTGE